eukprot:216724-Prymnesium_polylepis.1
MFSDGIPSRLIAGVLPTYHHLSSVPDVQPMPSILRREGGGYRKTNGRARGQLSAWRARAEG